MIVFGTYISYDDSPQVLLLYQRVKNPLERLQSYGEPG